MKRVAGLYMVALPNKKLLFFADTSVNIDPDVETLSEIAMAVKSGVECWCVLSWQLQPPPGGAPLRVVSFDDPDEFLVAISRRLGELSAEC